MTRKAKKKICPSAYVKLSLCAEWRHTPASVSACAVDSGVCSLCAYLHDGVSFTVPQLDFVICYLPFSTFPLTSEPLPRFCSFLKCHSLTTGSLRMKRQETKSPKLVLTSGHHWNSLSVLMQHYKHHTPSRQKGH